ncbi:MAG: hypothetical protein IT373_06840 [Polyangiaceae bacterium]|nr:hypothetical protein [Polyangiaceae bacterium]
MPRARSRPRAVLLGLAAALVAEGVLGGCSLGNVHVDACTADDECVLAFGLGSSCDAEGYCSDAASCQTGFDCHERFGGGACVAGTCSDVLPTLPGCTVSEPTALAGVRLTGPGSPLVLGSLFATDEQADMAYSAAARLAVREINTAGGLVDGRELAMLVCDIGGPGNALTGDARRDAVRGALDALAGTLGVPGLVGPSTSVDSLTAIGHVLASGYPTVLVSPSATSPALTTEPDKLAPSDPAGLFWRTAASDELQGQVLVDFVIGQYPVAAVITRLAVVYVQDAYGQGLANVVLQRFGSASTDLFPYDAATNLGALAAQVAAANPDGVLVVSLRAVDTVAILQEMALTSLAAKHFYFTDGSKESSVLLDATLPQVVKDIILGAAGTAPAAPRGPIFDQFNASLLADFGLDATQWSFLANAYDASYALGYASVFALSPGVPFDGRKLGEGLGRLSGGPAIDVGPSGWSSAKAALSAGPLAIDMTGTSGPLDFDPATGEAPGPIEIWRVLPDLSGFEELSVVVP